MRLSTFTPLPITGVQVVGFCNIFMTSIWMNYLYWKAKRNFDYIAGDLIEAALTGEMEPGQWLTP